MSGPETIEVLARMAAGEELGCDDFGRFALYSKDEGTGIVSSTVIEAEVAMGLLGGCYVSMALDCGSFRVYGLTSHGLSYLRARRPSAASV